MDIQAGPRDRAKALARAAATVKGYVRKPRPELLAGPFRSSRARMTGCANISLAVPATHCAYLIGIGLAIERQAP